MPFQVVDEQRGSIGLRKPDKPDELFFVQMMTEQAGMQDVDAIEVLEAIPVIVANKLDVETACILARVIDTYRLDVDTCQLHVWMIAFFPGMDALKRIAAAATDINQRTRPAWLQELLKPAKRHPIASKQVVNGVQFFEVQKQVGHGNMILIEQFFFMTAHFKHTVVAWFRC